MRIFKLLICVLLLIVLVACSKDELAKEITKILENTTTTVETTTSESITTSSVTTTDNELDEKVLWNEATSELENMINLTIIESLQTSYDYNGKKINTYIMNQIDIMSEAFMKFNIKYDLDFNKNLDETIYIKEENGQYFFYQYLNDILVKSEFDISLLDFNLDKPLYIYTFQNGMPDVNNTRIYQENNMEYVEFKSSIKLSELPYEYHNLFNENFNLMFGAIEPLNLEKEIEITIIFNLTNQSFEMISYDLSKLLDNIFKTHYYSKIKNICTVYTYTFTNKNSVNIDERNLKNAVYDNAPNGFELSLLSFPMYNINDTIEGTFEYSDDIDIINIHVDEPNKYQFISNNSISLHLLDEDCEELFVGDTNLITYLEKGDYYLKLHNEGNLGDYKITSSIITQDDYADFLFDATSVGIIGNNQIINGNIDFIGDIDIFKFLSSNNSGQFYSVTIKSDDNLVVIIDEYYLREYKPNNGVIEIGVGLHPNKYQYIYIQSTSLGSYQIEINLYNEDNDVSDSLDEELIPTITIGEPVVEATHYPNYMDTDVYQFNIVEAGIYEIRASILIGSSDYFLGKMEIYDSNKELLTDKKTYSFNPGNYYLLVEEGGGILYELMINKVIDDYETKITYILEDDYNIFTGSINYVDDIDEFEIQINEEGYYRIWLSQENPKYLHVHIKDQFENIIVDNSQFRKDTFYQYLYPGTFTVSVSGVYFYDNKYEVSFNKDGRVKFDIGYSYNLGDMYLGEITLDDVIDINFEYSNDIDVFKLIITESGGYSTNGKSIQRIVDMYGNEVSFDPQDRYLELTEGTYYLYFSYHIVSTDLFQIHLNVDDYENTIIYPLQLNEVREGKINYYTDIDQFEFVVTEPGIYQYNIDDIKIKLDIYDEAGNKINLLDWFFSKKVQLINQTYLVKVTYRKGIDLIDPIPYSLSFQLETTELDTDPDSAYLPIEMYRKLSLNETIFSKIESSEDVDVFVIELTEGGYYNINCDPLLSAVIFKSNGEEYTYFNREYLDKGINYVLIRSNQTIDYKIYISK